ncbi:MAG: methionine adenosyltransferase [Betaproteobacteria bacterium]|nr:methionine adenosyltransferase [Betaproteobacteria bacterium]
MRNGLFSSESVSEGHPDKLADRLSDAILDAFLAGEPDARVACESLLSNDLVVIAGEFRTRDEALFERIRDAAPAIARRVLRDSGYVEPWMGVDESRLEILVRFNHQSPHIQMGVDRDDGVLGAGDQGLMFGYACDDTPELMPLPIHLAHRLVQRQAQCRKEKVLDWLGPDAKSQVSIRYRDGEPGQVEAVVLSTQHREDIPIGQVRDAVRAEIIDPVIPTERRAPGMKVLINPTGLFVVGGPKGDTGLTGRKIIVDTYGGAVPHGGGAFSGKDPSKVDRSAAYMARFLARQVVARGWARKCLVQIAYAIGVAEPVSFLVETFGTGQRSADDTVNALRDEFDLTPAGILKTLDLRRPIYELTTNYGHFGRQRVEFTWERG